MTVRPKTERGRSCLCKHELDAVAKESGEVGKMVSHAATFSHMDMDALCSEHHVPKLH